MLKPFYFIIILFHLATLTIAQVNIIPNVPDHSQPPDTTLPSTKLNWSNYCAPYAYLNIVDYWENVYHHRNAQGMMAGLPAIQTAEYIGWFLDTNDNGDATRMNGTDPMQYPSAPGTYVIDESEGMPNYAKFDISNPLGFPYQIPPLKIAQDWQILPPHPEDFLVYMGEIDMGHLIKLDFLYWNPLPTGDSIIVSGEEPETVYIYKWGPQVSNTGGMENTPWEEWNMEKDPPERNIGHAVTGVGYILDTLEFAIVHDNWSSTPKNIAIPWRNMPAGTPYVTAMVLINLPPAIVKVSLPDTVAYSGDQLLIPLEIEDITGLHVRSFFTNITYNQNILQAKGATATNTISNPWGTPSVDMSTAGQLIVSNSGTPELSGSGNLVNLQFEVVGTVGDTTQLHFKTMVFNYGDPAPDTLSGSLAVIPKTVMVNIASNPSGLQIDVDGTPYTTPKPFNWNEMDSHQLNALSPQSGSTGIRFSYNSWSNNGSQQQTIVVPAKDTTFTANYYTEYELTTSVNPPASGTINIFPSQNWFISDSSVIMYAVPDTNYTFSGWSGDLSGSKNPDTLIMDSPKDVIANFSLATNLSPDLQRQIPTAFALKQNFPNPFNPTTFIEFELPRASTVKLQIFNLLGKEMDVLVSDRLVAGRYTVEWNAGRYASGVYIYRLEALESLTSLPNGPSTNGFVMTKKMIYMK